MDIVRGSVAVYNLELLIGLQSDNMRPIGATLLLQDGGLRRRLKGAISQTVGDKYDNIFRLGLGGIPSNFTIPVTDADGEVSAAATSVSQCPHVRVANTATTASQTHRVFISLLLIGFYPAFACQSTRPSFICHSLLSRPREAWRYSAPGPRSGPA